MFTIKDASGRAQRGRAFFCYPAAHFCKPPSHEIDVVVDGLNQRDTSDRPADIHFSVKTPETASYRPQVIGADVSGLNRKLIRAYVDSIVFPGVELCRMQRSTTEKAWDTIATVFGAFPFPVLPTRCMRAGNRQGR